jgi:acetyl-CoA acetyltransferase
MNDVAIIGAGLHPFGRFEGKSAMEMAADAIGLALADAGVEWKDIQFGVGGSWTVANPDAIVGMVGLTGIPFTDVFNACATAASATKLCADSIDWATTTSASRSGWTSTRAAPSPKIPHWSGCRASTPRTVNTSPPSSSG